MNIAILLTCFNRREKTVAFLRSLAKVHRPENCVLDIFLVDDGSTDGTGDAVRKFATEHDLCIKVIVGTGSLYWCGGMRLAWQVALAEETITHQAFDYFLWANDDVELRPNALNSLLFVAASPEYTPCGVVCGAFCDPQDGCFTYGGRSERMLLRPNGAPQECRYIHGNTVLVPRSTYEKIGMFDEQWNHGFGDTDYGLCCIKAGLKCWTTAEYIGTCKQHAIKAPWFSSAVPFRKRWASMWKPVGGNYIQFIQFRRKHYRYRWMIDAAKFFIQVLFPKPFEWYRK